MVEAEPFRFAAIERVRLSSIVDGPPLTAFALAVGSLCALASGLGYVPWAPSTWARWDSAHYVSIAEHGYSAFPCASGTGWCGNAAWFPGFPLVVAPLHAVGVPTLAASLTVVWSFALASLVALWRTFLAQGPTTVAVFGLAFAAWSPGQIYHYAVFPLSMFVFFTILHLRFLSVERWVAAGCAGAAAAVTYPLGIALAIGSTAWLVMTQRERCIRPLTLAVAPVVAVFGAVVGAIGLAAGRWTAFVDIQGRYEHGVHNPIGQITNAIRVVHNMRGIEIDRWAAVTAAQTLFVTAVIGTVLVSLAVDRCRGRRADEPTMLLVTTSVAIWLFPLTQSHVSVWRSQAALLPLGALVGRLPRMWAFTATLGAVALSVPVARLFFLGQLF